MDEALSRLGSEYGLLGIIVVILFLSLVAVVKWTVDQMADRQRESQEREEWLKAALDDGRDRLADHIRTMDAVTKDITALHVNLMRLTDTVREVAETSRRTAEMVKDMADHSSRIFNRTAN